MIRAALVLPSPRALLAPVSEIDPVAGLREVCRRAVEALPADPVVVVAPPVSDANAARGITEPLGHRVAAQLLDGLAFEARVAAPGVATGLRESAEPTTLVVMADGTARRDKQAPGFLHVDALPFDEAVEEALRTGDADALARLDPALGPELWCEGIPALVVLGEVARGCSVAAELIHAEAPWGVAWWVARWDLEPRA